MSPNDRIDNNLTEDLLHGAKRIAQYLGITESEAYYQIERGNIPVRRMGRKIIGSKTTLRRHFAPVEAA